MISIVLLALLGLVHCQTDSVSSALSSSNLTAISNSRHSVYRRGGRLARTSSTTAPYTPSTPLMTSDEPLHDVNDYYTTVRRLRSGATSRVSLVEDKVTGELAVCKIIHAESGARSMKGFTTLRDQVENEVYAMRALAGPLIIGFKGLYNEDEDENDMGFAILVEYLGDTWTDLATFLKNNSDLDERAIGAIFKHVLDAVSYMFNKGFVHRDMKGITN
jgi:serine/threonine protein kinase